MKKLLLGLFMGTVILTACGNTAEKSGDEEELPFLEVDLKVNPEKAEMGETVIFEAKVTYDGKPVTDADEVNFEIWRSQSEKHEKVAVEHKENGIYEWKKDFSEEGTYYIYAHVTAKDMHNMPKEEFIIGEPSEPENKNDSDMDMEENMEHSSH